jgi:hypothetical protein
MLLSNRQDSIFLLAALATLRHLFNATALGDVSLATPLFAQFLQTAAKNKKARVPTTAVREL